MSEQKPEHETPETSEVEEIEVVAHSDDDEEQNPGCIINNSNAL